MACVAMMVTLGTAGAGPAVETPVRILVLGDSLASGYGLEAGQSFPAQLEEVLRDAGHEVRILNAGIAGDTTAGGLARLDWSLAAKPHAVIVELGGNDGLRGVDPRSTHANLDAILTRLKSRNIPVLLTGMIAPSNMGRDYGEAFNAVFPNLAERHGVAFYPFILEGVAGRRDLNQDDGIHPNKSGVTIMVDRLVPHVVRLLETLE
jgi:acyl-CoA thioesterase-1